MPSAKPPTCDELRRRIEKHLSSLGCGLREKSVGIFEVHDLKSGKIIVTISNLKQFAETNGIDVS